MELWLQWLNMDFFTKKTEGRASFASPVKLLKTSKNSISEAQSLSKLFSVDTTHFFHQRLVYFRIDVVHRNFVVLHFWQSVTIYSVCFIRYLISRYDVYLGLCGDIQVQKLIWREIFCSIAVCALLRFGKTKRPANSEVFTTARIA